MSWHLYLLIDPRTNACRYVGYSANPKRRYGDHLRDRMPSHRINWIQSLFTEGLSPKLQVIAALSTIEEAQQLEIALIAKLRDRGVKLVNGTDGGEGRTGTKHSKETREQMSLSRRGELNPMYGRCGMDNPHSGVTRSEETRENMRQAWARRKLREGFQEKPHDPRTLREKRQDANKARWEVPGERERQSQLAKELNARRIRTSE